MPDAPADNRTLARRTLLTVGAMVGACVVAVGALTLLAVTVVEHTLVAPSGDTPGSASSSSAATAARRSPGGKPASGGTSTKPADRSQNPR